MITKEMVTKIVLADHRLKDRKIAWMVSICVLHTTTFSCMQNILSKHLEMEKLCARWGAAFADILPKIVQMDVSPQSLEHFKQNPNVFLCRFITCVLHYTLETNEQ